MRISIHPRPFTVGRSPGVSLALRTANVSKAHAEIYETKSGLRVRNLGSKNGTWVNHARVTDTAIREGDILHFGDQEFRLGHRAPEVESPVWDDETLFGWHEALRRWNEEEEARRHKKESDS